MSNYSELLKDPRWQKKRLEILQRDNWACTVCRNTERTLHVHHTRYLYNKDPWDYDDMHLITLCDSCHSLEEDLKKHNILYQHAKESNTTCIVLWDGLNFISYAAKYEPEILKDLFKQFRDKLYNGNHEQFVAHVTKTFNG